MSDTATIERKLRRLPSLAGPLWPFPADATPETPQALFLDWLDFAIDVGIQEPHAMTLSTVDASGFPDARTLILKALDTSWYFASDALGAKGRQIAQQPRVALTFYWARLVGRSVSAALLSRCRGPSAPAILRPARNRLGPLRSPAGRATC